MTACEIVTPNIVQSQKINTMTVVSQNVTLLILDIYSAFILIQFIQNFTVVLFFSLMANKYSIYIKSA